MYRQAGAGDLAALQQQLDAHQHDPRLVAVGEIGLDYFVPALTQSPLRELQEHYYRAQLKLARQFDLPVVVHVRRSADRLLKHLRAVAGPGGRWRGIAHAFNGSEVQAREFVQLGFKLGFGGAVTFERAHQLRRLAQTLAARRAGTGDRCARYSAPLAVHHGGRARGRQPQGRNTPAELPRIAEVVAGLRGISPQELARASTDNACDALPKLAALLV